MKNCYKKIMVRPTLTLLALLSLSLSGCLTASEGTAGGYSLYRFQCNNGEKLYMKINQSYTGIIKYEGRALKVTGRKMEQGAKYVTSDHRLILFQDQNDNMTIHVLREGSVFCQEAGIHEAG